MMDKAQRIIEILNNKRDGTVHGAFMGEIADELDTLRAENERLRKALAHIMSRYEEGTIAHWKAKEALK